jgi:hypothetical protein
MKTQIKLTLALAACLAAFTSSLFAQLSIPSDGSDGALIISNNTVIDLGQAVTGNWTNNNTANAGRGIYDPDKWAVVFKYSSVVISNGATLTFSNHPTHAPVVWLVNGNVTIDGWLSLDGVYGGTDTVNPPEGGPGGFRGGATVQSTLGYSGGFGPGGAYNDHGQYGAGQPRSYGNPQIVPLIGGSGGSASDNGQNGGGGGGAILIAASSAISVSGTGAISADGGYGPWAAAGSGGAIRLVADQITGSGRIEAVVMNGRGGYPGRIRLEANTASGSLNLDPPVIAVPPTPLIIWPDTNAPSVKVVSVASLTAPADPKAAMTSNGDDLTIANTNAVVILLQTSNFPTSGTVNVYIQPRNAPQSILQASFVSGNTNLANWQLTTILPLSHTIIQARAVSP